MIQKIKETCYDQFEKRRELVSVVVIFCMFTILYIMFAAKTTPIYITIVDNSYWLLGSVVLGYIFGRTIGDFAGKRSMKGLFGQTVSETVTPTEEIEEDTPKPKKKRVENKELI